MSSDNEYELKKSEGEMDSFSTGARRDNSTAKPRLSLLSFPAVIRIAWVYTRGAERYGEHNWQKGMPYSRYLDSALRHIAAWVKGERDEDHLAMACWNLMAIMHHQEVGPPNLDDVTGYNTPEGVEAVRPDVLLDHHGSVVQQPFAGERP